jgi:ankyrin repeat protein
MDAEEKKLLNNELFAAAYNGYYDKLAKLINEGADLDSAHTGGSTALHAAAKKGYQQIVKLLIEKGAKLD